MKEETSEHIYQSTSYHIVGRCEARHNEHTFDSELVKPDISEQSIKPYKLKRLSFVNDGCFWHIWNEADFQGKTYIQLLYKLATSMSLAGFRSDEMMIMLIGWNNKHEFTMNVEGCKDIITSVNAFTLETRRERNRKNVRRYRAKKKLYKILNAPKPEESGHGG